MGGEEGELMETTANIMAATETLTASHTDTSTTSNDKSQVDPAALLESTAENCHFLAEWVRKASFKFNAPQKVVSSQTEDFPVTVVDEKKLHASIEENIRLRAIIQDVTEANKRWQKYNQERQDYVQKLVETIRELRDSYSLKTTDSRGESIVEESRTDLELNIAQLLEEKKQLEKEVEDTKKKLAQMTNKYEQAKKDHKEHVEILELQAKGNKDDWEAERREKHQLRERNQQLHDEINRLVTKIQEIEMHQIVEPSLRTGRCHLHNGFYTEPLTPPRYTPRDITPARNHYITDDRFNDLIPRSPDVSATEKDDLTIDGVSASKDPDKKERTKKLAKNHLLCPTCSQEFPPELHIDFLDHFDKCQVK